ncbi:MAG TPA: hypothetical protein VK835_10010 [Bacteroidia bacterium]|jgi:hypothetical protein|nr:hypothetical protein [Bacteroidia bacterium]
MKTSDFLKLDIRDILKACIIATLTPVLVLVQQSIDAGQLTFDYKHLGMAAIGGFVAYLIKNFLTPPAIVSKIQIEAQKN